MRRHALALGLCALVTFAVVGAAGIGGQGSAEETTQGRPLELAHFDRATLADDSLAITADASPESRNGSSDTRRFDPPWAALVAAALLVAAIQRTSSRESRGRAPAPLSTRAPARAPPLVTSFAPAR